MLLFSEMESGLSDSSCPDLSFSQTLAAPHTALGWLFLARKCRCLLVDLGLPLSTEMHPLGGGPELMNERIATVPAPSVCD